MTAEIAILNKTAVALATDSAVTISSGRKEHKIFDSADKLFELSEANPIGIMIYNGMSFVEIPLPSIIRRFRKNCSNSKSVEDCAISFLNYLNDAGVQTPDEIQDRSIRFIVEPVIYRLSKIFDKKVKDKTIKAEALDQGIVSSLLEDTINEFREICEELGDAEFIGEGPFVCPKHKENIIIDIAKDKIPNASNEQIDRIVDLGKVLLRKQFLSDLSTGIVIAGFGSGDMFPTLISYEIDGMVFGRLKYVKTQKISISHEGPRAAVLPFAQKEMVERFLYGLDEEIQEQISDFCEETIPDIRKQVFAEIAQDIEHKREDLEASAEAAESAFIKGLREQAFDKIRAQSREEIEDMVEFMPKPELAKMAEALVNLTSIKRRVSRGVETVGGPIDVAVISESEGFVWVKRKHYFPADLNTRYLSRVRMNGQQQQVSESEG